MRGEDVLHYVVSNTLRQPTFGPGDDWPQAVLVLAMHRPGTTFVDLQHGFQGGDRRLVKLAGEVQVGP